MKKSIFRILTYGFFIGGAFSITSCSNDDDNSGTDSPGGNTEGRWFTVAGAIMDETPGNGNGGTVIYSVSEEDARNPKHEIKVFENGYKVKSQRTARLQSSVDGSVMFNIAYGGDIGGEFSKYNVTGGNNFQQTGGVVNISQYAGTAPRWSKLYNGDKTGVAVSVTSPQVNEGETYEYTRGTATVVSLDMENVFISKNNSFEIPLTEAEENEGHHIFRLDSPILNAAGDKLIIGTWMRKTDPATGERDDSDYAKLGTKSVVVDYPSLENPTIINSTQGHGDTSGYRSCIGFLAEDGNIYQATHRDDNGSHMLRINSNNDYDNTYAISFDEALGVQNSYIESWRYVGNGVGYAMYTHDGALPSNFNDGGSSQSFLAKVDLYAGTAEKIDLPYDADMYFFQYQGYAVNDNEVFVAISSVGKDGNIYILNSETGEVAKGAKLINEPGNHFIGIF